MKSALTLFLFPLFLTGVFCDDVSVSVMEGDSVTLNTDTIIQSNEGIEWKFRDVLIARINRGSSKISVKVQPDGPFKDRLQLDNQTGDLKIMNIRSTDSGPFTLDVRRTKSSSTKIFNLTVSGVDEVKSVSVIVGDSVTLNSGTNIQRDDVIEWRFQNSPIAEHNRKTGNFSTSDGPNGRFRGRLKLDYLTGSLTIRKIGTEHSGFYEAGIRKSSRTHTIHRSYSVTASGELKSALSVKKGESVTLNSGLTEIQRYDLMQWMFEDTVIADINKAHKQFPDGRFRERLELDEKTGSLTITDTRTTDSGLYELQINIIRFTMNKRITVTVSDPGLSSGAIAGISAGVLLAFAAAVAGVIYQRRKNSELKEQTLRRLQEMKEETTTLIAQGIEYTLRILSVFVGELITLTPDEKHKDGKLLWIFRGYCIAEWERAARRFTVHDDLPDGISKDRLELDHQTGSLTITNTRDTDSGEYALLIIRSGKISINKFRVSVFAQTNNIKTVSVKEGGSVTLETGVTDIQEDGHIRWKFGYTPLAVITGWIKEISPFSDEIFKDRLKLNHKTGSLTIKKIRPTDAGIYMLDKIEGENITNKLFRVEVSDSTDNRNDPEENVPLKNFP